MTEYKENYDRGVEKISNLDMVKINIGDVDERPALDIILEKVPDFRDATPMEVSMRKKLSMASPINTPGFYTLIFHTYCDAYRTIDLCLSPGEYADVELFLHNFSMKLTNITGPFRFDDKFPTEKFGHLFPLILVTIHNEDWNSKHVTDLASHVRSSHPGLQTPPPVGSKTLTTVGSQTLSHLGSQTLFERRYIVDMIFRNHIQEKCQQIMKEEYDDKIIPK